jgi:alpha-ketoglutarate-dependent taurine dioxygenase
MNNASKTNDTLFSSLQELTGRGWTVITSDQLIESIPTTLERFGNIIPQFGGQYTFEITFKPGYDDLPYSQSRNGIGPHTEAPVYDPPPRYLALHCHQQARCGGGHTSLADGYAFLESLPMELRHWIDNNKVEFGATATPGEPGKRVLQASLLEADQVFRFSFNQFHYGDVNPSKDALKTSHIADSNSPLAQIARLGERYFLEHATPVLIPDGAVLLWDNWWLMHARSEFQDPGRHLTRYWLA